MIASVEQNEGSGQARRKAAMAVLAHSDAAAIGKCLQAIRILIFWTLSLLHNAIDLLLVP